MAAVKTPSTSRRPAIADARAINSAVKSRLASRVAMWGLIVIVAATYGRICFADFTWWDDNLTIHHNPAFNPPSVQSILWFWGHSHSWMYVPVTYTVWGLLAFLGWSKTPDAFGISLNPGIFHLASLVAHGATALLVFAILRRLFRRDWAALAGALLYAVHPIQVETVAWATALKEGLCGLFAMASLWLYLRGIRLDSEIHSDVDDDRLAASRAGRFSSAGNPLIDRKKRPTSGDAKQTAPNPDVRHGLDFGFASYVLSALALVLAQLSNPLAVVIPIMAFILDWLVVGRAVRRVVTATAPLLVISIAGAIVARAVQPGISAPPVPIWARPLVASDTLAFYLYKLMFPLHLACDYGRRPDLALARGWLSWTWIVPAVVAGALAIVGRGRRWLVAGALLLVIGVAPVLGLIPFDLQQFTTPADRYMYLAMLGPALIVAGWFAGRRSVGQWALLGLVLATLAVRTSVQCGVWHDDMTLWKHAAAVSPDSHLAHNNIGAAYQRLGPQFLSAAMDEYAQAIRVNPNFFQAHDNLALALLSQGREEEAMREIREALRIQNTARVPKDFQNAAPNFVLGSLLLKHGRADEAIVYLEHALEKDANYPRARALLDEARRAENAGKSSRR